MLNPASRLARSSGLLAVLVAAACCGRAVAADPLPDPQVLLARHIEATGGEAAYRAWQSFRYVGLWGKPGVGYGVPMTRLGARPNLYSESHSRKGDYVNETVVNGDLVWARGSEEAGHLVDEFDRVRDVRDATFAAPLHWKQMYKKLQTVGEVVIDGQVCYKVLRIPHTGDPEYAYFAKDSHLLVKTEGPRITTNGEMTMEIFFRNYQPVEKVLVPYQITLVMGSDAREFTVANAQHNIDLPADSFEPPAHVARNFERMFKRKPKIHTLAAAAAASPAEGESQVPSGARDHGHDHGHDHDHDHP